MPVWAPYYTLHKILAGLLDSYELCGNRQALDVLQRAVGWVQFRMDRLTHEQQQLMLETEFGGMERSAGEPLRRDRQPGSSAALQEPSITMPCSARSPMAAIRWTACTPIPRSPR